MSETKFTKGDWAVEDGRVVVCGDFKVAYSYSGSSVPFIEHIKSNAHLIAAAPEMYKFLDDLANGRGIDYPIEKLLAKARGEKC